MGAGVDDDVEVGPLVVSDVEHRDDVWVAQAHHEARLVEPGLVAVVAAVEALDRDRLAPAEVDRREHEPG